MVLSEQKQVEARLKAKDYVVTSVVLTGDEVIADAHTQRRDQRLDFLVVEDFIQPGALCIQDFPAQGQDSLEATIASLLG